MIPDANTETNGNVERIETREANSGYFKSNTAVVHCSCCGRDRAERCLKLIQFYKSFQFKLLSRAS